ncbi:hypothetical protein HDU86_005780 [Geranomyces michiganensis]|nr:hypothetical protein HDU86_005780 [Geranomyces michiganensis]
MHFSIAARRHSRRVLVLLAAASVACLFLLASSRGPSILHPKYHHRVRLADPIPSDQNIAHPETVPPDPRQGKKQQQEKELEQQKPPPSEPLFYTGIPGLTIPYPTILAPVATTPNASVAGAYSPIYDEYEVVRPRPYQSEIPQGATLLLTPDEYAIPKGRGPKPPTGPDGKPVRGKKYFYEKSNHFDARWFVAKTPDELRPPLIKNLFAAWSRFADERQIPYWIMHGTLLGWYFGGRQMPWDDDMDIQVNANMLYVLAQYNMTRGTGNDMRYILDVNPNHTTRHHEKANVIDARFIDTHTGHFIDITGLAFPTEEDEVVMCKTPHRYRLDQIYPLVRTVFEGVQTWRPYAVTSVLRKEYRAGVLEKLKYNRHVFDEQKHRWMKDLSLPPLPPPPVNKPSVPAHPSSGGGGALKLTPVTSGNATRFVAAAAATAASPGDAAKQKQKEAASAAPKDKEAAERQHKEATERKETEAAERQHKEAAERKEKEAAERKDKEAAEHQEKEQAAEKAKQAAAAPLMRKENEKTVAQAPPSSNSKPAILARRNPPPRKHVAF